MSLPLGVKNNVGTGYLLNDRLRQLIACRRTPGERASAFDNDTHNSIWAGDLRIMISKAGSGSGSNVEIVTDFLSIRAIG